MLSESFLPFFQWCERTWLGTTVRDIIWAFPVIETFHLLALAVLLGTVLIVNLGTFGIGPKRFSDPGLARELDPWLVTSIVVLIATGIPMMMSEPMKCYESISFPIKMVLMVVGIVWHFTLQRKWTTDGASPMKCRLAACFSIFVWLTVGIAGKGIPYV